jgi:hypothetical protein
MFPQTELCRIVRTTPDHVHTHRDGSVSRLGQFLLPINAKCYDAVILSTSAFRSCYEAFHEPLSLSKDICSKVPIGVLRFASSLHSKNFVQGGPTFHRS